MLKELRKIDGKTIDRNPWWEYRYDRYHHPDGSEGEYYFVHTPGSAMVVPVTPEGNLVFVKQFRYLNGRVSIEFPGGGVKEGQSASDAANRELKEETGFEAGRLRELGIFNPMNGVTDELCTVFMATDLKKSVATPEPTEEFELLELSIDECHAAIRSGQLWDGMTLAALMIFEQIRDSNG
jgi:ADP-ribose pyrophosphatase